MRYEINDDFIIGRSLLLLVREMRETPELYWPEDKRDKSFDEKLMAAWGEFKAVHWRFHPGHDVDSNLFGYLKTVNGIEEALWPSMRSLYCHVNGNVDFDRFEDNIMDIGRRLTFELKENCKIGTNPRDRQRLAEYEYKYFVECLDCKRVSYRRFSDTQGAQRFRAMRACPCKSLEVAV